MCGATGIIKQHVGIQLTKVQENNPTSDIRKHHMEQEISLLELFKVLAIRKRFIFQFTLGVVAVSAVIAVLLPNQYTAETLVLPPAPTSSLNTALASQLGSGALASLATGGLGIKNPGDMYVGLFRSRTVEDGVIQRFGLMARYKLKRMVDTRKKFEDRSTVSFGAKDGLIRIDVRDRDPKFAADIANGYVDEFRKLSATLAITEASQRRVFFQGQLAEAKDNLAKAEEAMKNTQQRTGVLQIDSQAKSLIESASMLRAQIVAKQVQIRGMRSFATDDNPDLMKAPQELAALESQVAKLGGAEQAPDSLLVPKGKVPEAGLEYIRAYRDVKYFETIFELIAKQLEVAKLDEARQGAVMQVVDVAVPPDKKSFPPRLLIIALSMVMAAIIASIIALYLEEYRKVGARALR